MVVGIVADVQKGRRRRRVGVSRSQTHAMQTLPPALKCAHPPPVPHSALADQAFSFSLVRVVFAGILMSAGDWTEIRAMGNLIFLLQPATSYLPARLFKLSWKLPMYVSGRIHTGPRGLIWTLQISHRCFTCSPSGPNLLPCLLLPNPCCTWGQRCLLQQAITGFHSSFLHLLGLKVSWSVSLQIGSVCRLRCRSGWARNGKARWTCLPSGQWEEGRGRSFLELLVLSCFLQY